LAKDRVVFRSEELHRGEQGGWWKKSWGKSIETKRKVTCKGTARTLGSEIDIVKPRRKMREHGGAKG